MTSFTATLDSEEIRAERPGSRIVCTLNNACADLMPRPVLDAMIQYLEREAALGGYEAADKSALRLDGVYDRVGSLVGRGPGRDRTGREWHSWLANGFL